MNRPKRRIANLGAALALIAAGLVASGTARADGDTAACVASHREAQRARAEHHLLDAKEKLLACGQTSCPELIRGDCTQWLADLEPRIPTVVLGAELEPAIVQSSIRVAIDGGARVPLDGRAIAVDPGEHVFRFEVAGRAPIEERVVILEGQQARRVSLPSSPSSAAPSSSVPGAAIALGGVGVVSLGVFAGFGIAGLAKRNQLDDAGCRPNCATTNVDIARRDFAIADVTLGIGVAAIVAGVIVLALRPTRPRPPARTALTIAF